MIFTLTSIPCVIQTLYTAQEIALYQYSDCVATTLLLTVRVDKK
jgi:hypothetical protein